MRHPIALALFLALAVGGGMAIGYFTRPGEWYAALAKPSFNPPDWVFGPVWGVLYVLVAVAGWRTWVRAGTGTATWLWAAQLALNFAWSPLFFAAHRVGAALLVVALMLAAICAFIAERWNADRPAALMFVPYAAWVAFATLLNASIWLLN